MSKPGNPPSLLGNRPLAGPVGGGLRGPGLAPMPPKGRCSGRWVFWLVIVPLLLLVLTYVLGRTVEPIRARLAQVPVAGQLFAGKVWPVLWNKPAAPKPSATAGSGTGTSGAASPGGNGATKAADSATVNEIAARLAAVQAKEADVQKQQADLKVQQDALNAEQAKLAQDKQDVAALKTQLQGELRTEKDRVDVVRSMRTSAQVQFFGALTDDEALAVLKYMTADEVARILGGMDPKRAARLFEQLPLVAPSSTTTP